MDNLWNIEFQFIVSNHLFDKCYKSNIILDNTNRVDKNFYG